MTPPRIVKYGTGKLANGAYGFPRGQERRVEPWVLICIHISGNSRTARMPIGIGSGTGTRAEVAYMARDRRWSSDSPDYGNSAHDYVARDGSVLACIPTRYAAWNNGDIARPNTSLSSIKRILRERREKGHNPNEAYHREIECTGSFPNLPLTGEQRETVAYLIARDSIATGLPISRETVHIHADIDGVDRLNCPFSARSREEQVAALITRARAIKALIKDPQPDPEPDPEPEPDPCEAVTEQLQAALGEAQRLRADRRLMVAAIGQAIGALDDYADEEPPQ